MNNLEFTHTYVNNDLHTSFLVKELSYDCVEIVISRKVVEKGVVIQDSSLKMYPSKAELAEMFTPFINHLKDNYVQTSNQ